ncbi:MAG: ABC transporter ATP-binding protein, partial [Calditrichaeota bacterium]|nr:ABC transporter ATP-binding protein [Calditrichota bacterium]
MGKTASFFARLTGIKSTRTKAEDLPSFKERMNALGNLPKLFRLIWETSRWMTISTLLLRLLQAAVPLVTLYLGKLIIDEIVRLYNAGGGDLTRLWE